MFLLHHVVLRGKHVAFFLLPKRKWLKGTGMWLSSLGGRGGVLANVFLAEFCYLCCLGTGRLGGGQKSMAGCRGI